MRSPSGARIPKASLSWLIEESGTDTLLADAELPFKQRLCERKVQTGETFIEVAMIRLILRRLVKGV